MIDMPVSICYCYISEPNNFTRQLEVCSVERGICPIASIAVAFRRFTFLLRGAQFTIVVSAMCKVTINNTEVQKHKEILSDLWS